MRVAVTGASGFVGRNLVSDLTRAGIAVVPLSRSPIDHPDWRAAPELGDGGGAGAWAAALSGVDAVVHCAARAHVMRENAADPLGTFRQINRDGAIAVAEGAATAGAKRFVFASTVKVLGETTTDRPAFRNTDPLAPEDPYAISKAEAETALATISARSGMGLVVLRLPLVYGPGAGGNLAALTRLVRRGAPLPLGSARTNRRSMISTANLSDAVRAALTADVAGMRLLVSDGSDLSTRALVEGIAAAVGRRARLFTIPPPAMRVALVGIGRSAVWTRLFGDLSVDIGETCDRLGWQPRHSVSEGLAAMAMGGDAR